MSIWIFQNKYICIHKCVYIYICIYYNASRISRQNGRPQQEMICQERMVWGIHSQMGFQFLIINSIYWGCSGAVCIYSLLNQTYNFQTNAG